MPARWSRIHSSAKILSMKRSSRVSFVSQRTTSLSECAVTGSMFGGAFISCSRAVTWIDGTGYVVSPLDGAGDAGGAEEFSFDDSALGWMQKDGPGIPGSCQRLLQIGSALDRPKA